MALIVVMEDDAATRTLVVLVLKKDGYDVLSSENGADGLALVRMHKPDLFISDVQMPVMDGFAMLQALRADPDLLAIPVVLLTFLQERAHMRIGMTSGADDYVTKHFWPVEPREAAAAQLNRRQMRVRRFLGCRRRFCCRPALAVAGRLFANAGHQFARGGLSGRRSRPLGKQFSW